MKKNYYNLAKKYDKNGKFAFWGMCDYLKECFDVNFLDDNENDAIEYIVETYLECIDSVSFENWVRKGNKDGRPLVMTEYRFKKMYPEIFQNNSTLESAIDDIASIYGCEWWIFERYEESSPCLATTYYKDDYSQINIANVEKMMASFDTALTLNAVTEEIRQIFIQQINEATNNFFDGYKVEEMSNKELFDELDYKLGLGYQTGRNEDWLLYKEVI